jgi:hypothetical protein
MSRNRDGDEQWNGQREQRNTSHEAPGSVGRKLAARRAALKGRATSAAAPDASGEIRPRPDTPSRARGFPSP